MPPRKTKETAAADTGTKVRAEKLAAADRAAAALVSEAAVGLADVTRGEDEAAAATTLSVLGDAAAQRGARDAAEGAADLSMADELAAGGELATALSTDEFRRGMERADIAGQVQVAAVLLHGVANAMGGMAQELANGPRGPVRGATLDRTRLASGGRNGASEPDNLGGR